MGDKVGMWIVRLRKEKCIRPSEMKRANEMSVIKNAAYPSEEHTWKERKGENWVRVMFRISHRNAESHQITLEEVSFIC